MTRQQYISMVAKTRSFCRRTPLGDKILLVPTLLCAAVYLLSLLMLLLRAQYMLLFRAAFVPAVCFLLVTLLRPLIGRERPYDHFDAIPVGRYRKGKGKSMPSRHTVSASAIAIAIIALHPVLPVAACMIVLCLIIAFLRVASGQHYPSDVIAALFLSAAVSAFLYSIL